MSRGLTNGATLGCVRPYALSAAVSLADGGSWQHAGQAAVDFVEMIGA